MANTVIITYNDGTAEKTLTSVTAITVKRHPTGLKDDTRPLIADITGSPNVADLDLHNVDKVTLTT